MRHALTASAIALILGSGSATAGEQNASTTPGAPVILGDSELDLIVAGDVLSPGTLAGDTYAVPDVLYDTWSEHADDGVGQFTTGGFGNVEAVIITAPATQQRVTVADGL